MQLAVSHSLGTFVLSVNIQWVPAVCHTLSKALHGPFLKRDEYFYLLSTNRVLDRSCLILLTIHHFVGEETLDQRGKVTCRRSHSERRVEPGLKAKS